MEHPRKRTKMSGLDWIGKSTWMNINELLSICREYPTLHIVVTNNKHACYIKDQVAYPSYNRSSTVAQGAG